LAQRLVVPPVIGYYVVIKIAGVSVMTVAGIVQALDGCPDDYHFSPDERNAFHLFEHRLLASLYRLYIHVPTEKADKALARKLREIVAKLPDDD
jgi:hypothetical protein